MNRTNEKGTAMQKDERFEKSALARRQRTARANNGTTSSDQNLSLSVEGIGAGSAAYQAWLDKLSILKRFNGQTFLLVPAAGTTLAIDRFAERDVIVKSRHWLDAAGICANDEWSMAA